MKTKREMADETARKVVEAIAKIKRRKSDVYITQDMDFVAIVPASRKASKFLKEAGFAPEYGKAHDGTDRDCYYIKVPQADDMATLSVKTRRRQNIEWRICYLETFETKKEGMAKMWEVIEKIRHMSPINDGTGYPYLGKRNDIALVSIDCGANDKDDIKVKWGGNIID